MKNDILKEDCVSAIEDGSVGGGLSVRVGDGSVGGGLSVRVGDGSVGGGLSVGVGDDSVGGGLSVGVGDGLEISFPDSIRKIDIVNVSHVTRELPVALLSAIRFVHPYPERVNCVGEFILEDPETLYIIICPAGLGSETYHRGPRYYITYQLEPTPVLHREPYLDFLRKALYNWDYSQVNVDYLRQHHPEIKSIYFPIGYTPYIAPPDINDGRYFYDDSDRTIDVLFLGWDRYERRERIREDLKAAELNVVFIANLFIEGMQQIIRRSKICLNLRVVTGYVCLETIRLNVLLSNQACIVNETLDNPTELATYSDAIINVPYADLVKTCVDLVADPATRQRQAIRSFQWYRNTRQWSQIVDFNKLLPSTPTPPTL